MRTSKTIFIAAFVFVFGVSIQTDSFSGAIHPSSALRPSMSVHAFVVHARHATYSQFSVRGHGHGAGLIPAAFLHGLASAGFAFRATDSAHNTLARHPSWARPPPAT